MEDLRNNHFVERVSITPSGFFGDSPDNIVALENFMTEEELSKLNDFIRSNTNWDVTETHHNENGTVTYDADYWANRVATYPTIQKSSLEVPVIIEKMVRRLKIGGQVL
jgi:hypothetical protein